MSVVEFMGNIFGHLDPATFPVSSRGCWLSLAVRDKRHDEQYRPQGDGLYLRSHHGAFLNQREFCRIDLLRGGKTIGFTSETEPGLLRLLPKEGAGEVELLLLAPGNLRIRSSDGLGLKLSVLPMGANVAYAFSDQLLTLNVRSSRIRLQIECLEGSQLLDSPWGEIACEKIEATLEAPAGGRGEWAIDAFRSTWVRPERLDFEDLKAELADGYRNFASKQNGVKEEFEHTRDMAALCNWSCLVSPDGRFERESMLMSKGWMDQVWSWDNCFNAMALAAQMPELAMEQLMVVIDRQDEHGAYPDACNDVHEHYNFSKPPVWGIAIDDLRGSNPDWFTLERLRPVYDSVLRYTNWWLDNRRLPGDTLCYYLHGNDSGWDNSTQFDEGVPLIAPDLNAFLIRQMEVLAGLAEEYGETEEASRLAALADELFGSLMERLWDGERFCGICNGEKIRSESLIPCMPIVLGKRLQVDVIQKLVSQIEEHVTEWGPATEKPDSPKYTSDGYWRGPIWGPSTVLVVLGLERSGQAELADLISARFARLCKKSGFAENFDGLTGESLRDPAYSWTASAFLRLARC